MAKPDKPIFSLGATGTIADALTYQKRGRETIVREKPIPKDPYSLNQAYQRWDYRDYAYLWTLLSNSEKQIYRTKASRYHITGFSQFMRENLKDLTNLVARWHLDEKSGATAFDTSKNNNDGIIYGATPATGRIDGAYYFDGLNDYIDFITTPSFMPLQDCSILFFLNAPSQARSGIITDFTAGGPGIDDGRGLFIEADGAIYFYVSDATRNRVNINAPFTPNTPFLITAIHDYQNSMIYLYIDTTLMASIASTGSSPSPSALLAGKAAWGWFFEGILDNISLYDRVVDITEIRRHSERRYPA